jgi:uncharacterized protein
MKVQESFVIDEPRERLWEFFDEVDQVARCVPGVESVEVIDSDNSKIRVTQAVGPMTATFDLKMRVTERRPQEHLQFTAVGRAVKGAAGNVRTTNTVRLAEVEEGTRVELESDLAMGGVLGSVGQKVVAKQAGEVTRQFSDALERAIKGEPAPVEVGGGAGAEPAAGVVPADGTPRPRPPAVAALAALALAFVLWRIVRGLRNR